jgi:uncharacterized membrane protein HdeD (DUF308 family)
MLFWEELSKESLTKGKRRSYLIGALSIIMGIISIAMPLLASFAVETLAGGLLFGIALCSGFITVRCFKDGSSPWLMLFMTIISFAAGLIFILYPVAGVKTLAFLLAAYFLVDGIVKILEYVRLHSIGGSVWLLISGLIGVILAFMMWKNFFTGAAVIGTLLGLNLIIGGLCFIIFGRGCSAAAKDMEDAQPEIQDETPKDDDTKENQ